MRKIVASVQVRLNSERLPSKVLKDINGKPLLSYLIDRLKKSKLIDQIIIATSINEENDKIENFCVKNNLACYRGSENDVLSRTTEALKSVKATHGVEVYGDCPLIDPEIIDYIINDFLEENDQYDFVGNNLKTTFPPGMEVEVFKFSALSDANKLVNDPIIREHGTLFIRQNPIKYKIKNIEAPIKWRRPDLEIEVDTEEDFHVISKILENFNYSSSISLQEIIKLLEHGNVSLDDSIKYYEQGVLLKTYCEDRLKKAELKIKSVLRETKDVDK